MKLGTILIFLIGTSWMQVFVDEAQAIPRYSARYGQKCQLCHNNPTGGGMRSAYASQYLMPFEMVMKQPGMEAAERIDPQLNENISMGADLRTLARYSADDEVENENNIFQMQGDVYLHFQLDDRFSAYFDQGLSGTYELYGLGYVLPASGYFKVGRFTPAYGWKFADHKQFVRDELGFAPPGHSDVGVELGFFPGDASFNVALLNGAPGSVLDTDDRQAFAARAEWRRSLGSANLALGGSWYREDETGEEHWMAGPFLYLDWGPVTWVGEWDWERQEGGNVLTSFVTSHELTYQLKRGLDLRATYSFLDPDLDFASGSRSRTGLGVDMLATPFVGVLLMANHYEFESAAPGENQEYIQGELVLHFLY